MTFLDTETCGFEGPPVLIQHAEGDGRVNLHSIWTEPISETLELIESFCAVPIVAFNITFDWFQICKIYTTLRQLPNHWYPIDHINEVAEAEPEGRFGPCLKPIKAFDIMLHARKGKYQSTMNRSPIKVRRVPTVLAEAIRDELNVRAPFKDIYFAKAKDKTIRWQIEDVKNDLDEDIPELKNIVLRFRPSSALKALVADALDIDTVLYQDVGVPSKARPVEHGYAPFALAIGDRTNWRGAWPDVIRIHIRHWTYNKLAREYATSDVTHLQKLYEFFGCPEIDDDDSVLACMMGAVRWKGFAIDEDKIRHLLERNNKLFETSPLKKGFSGDSLYKAPAPKIARRYLEQVMTEVERLIIQQSTKAVILEEVSTWTDADVCDSCRGQGCIQCDNGFVKSTILHPAADRARHILDLRRAASTNVLYSKILSAGRFHAAQDVLGTLSNRASGSGGELNSQGIQRSSEVRSCFTLKDDDSVLCGGDFDGSQIAIAVTVYQEKELEKLLLSGKSIHALFGEEAFPPKTHDEILATKGASDLFDDLYTRSKRGVFGLLFGGTDHTLVKRVGIEKEAALIAFNNWLKRFPAWGKARERIYDKFCSMRQPRGIGTAVVWKDPEDYIESFYGFRRYFTAENRVVKVLYELSENIPKAWTLYRMRITRRDREQTVAGAIRSAIYAAAFAIQAANMRAAANHEIQSPEATQIKMCQRRIWDVQPYGINEWLVQSLSIHDELFAVTAKSVVQTVETIVNDFIIELKKDFPLMDMTWHINMVSWEEK